MNYKGNGSLSVEKITLYQSRMGCVKIMAVVFLLFSIAEASLFYFTKNPKKKGTAVGLLAIAAAAFLPYMIYGLLKGHDFSYHFVRIEGIVEEIKNGQFPVYMQSLWMNGYGCPVSVYYGDFLLYIPAFFRLAGFSFNTAYKIFVFLINLFTAVFSYYAFQRIFKKDYIAWVLTFVYVCAPYRLVDIYVRFAVGEYSALMFLPLVCVGFYGIVMEAPKRKDSLLLGLGMAGILCSHSLMVEMTATILLIVCVILWKRVLIWERIKALITAVLYCLFAALFYLVPFLDSYINNDIAIKHYTEDSVAAIQGAGAPIGQYFSFFQDIFGSGGTGDRLSDKMYLSIGLTLMSAFIIALIVIFRKKENQRLRFFTGMTFLTLFLASDLFPWNSLSCYTSVGNFLAQIQFPWRYLTFATLFSVLLLGELLILAEKKIVEREIPFSFKTVMYSLGIAVCLISAFELLWFHSNYASTTGRVFVYNTAEIDNGSRDFSHYMRYGSKLKNLTYEIKTDNALYSAAERNGTDMTLLVKTEDMEGTVSVPIFNYKGYHVRDEYGTEYEIFDGENNEISFTLPANFAGKISVTFEAPWYWLAAWLVSAIFIALLIAGKFLTVCRRAAR